MIVYEATKSGFLEDVFHDELVGNIVNNYEAKVGGINKSEVRSWDNSMQYMYRILSDNTIPDNAGVAIEFKIPHTSKRVDFLISGRKEETAPPTVVIVELKQWETAEKVEHKEAIVRTPIRQRLVETTNPSYQAWSYAALLHDYNATVQEETIDLKPCAYLHNYLLTETDPLTDTSYAPYIADAPIFAKGDAGRLRDFIKRYVVHGDDKETLYKVEQGKIRPSKSLQDSLNAMLQGNEAFVMIDDQKVVYEEALHLAERAQRTNTTQVLVVNGGPGTGKSVLAVNLLVAVTRQGLVAQYVTKNAAPRHVYAAKLKKGFKKTRIDNLFKGSGSYVDAEENAFDALLVDEAHRLNEKSGMFQHLGEDQTKELIHAGRLVVFFMDEHQRVTLKDAGSNERIQRFAAAAGAEISYAELASQFRCSGSDGYMAWVDDVLQIRETANQDVIGTDYDVQVFRDPHELYEAVKAKNTNNKARMLAGYCWEWPKDGRDDSDVHEIVLEEEGFSMSWNLGNSDTWAVDPDSIVEAGCIHTSQGLEFDYVGVIIGGDLYAEDGVVHTNPAARAKSDQSLRGIKKMRKEAPAQADQLADEIIRNTYRTLLTRGQKGCYIYCTDQGLTNYLEARIKATEDAFSSTNFFDKPAHVAEEPSDYDTT
ncbi:hypothetical protein B0H94_11454 [Salsuginibacillus halophilus]|uniref:Schlafen group 3-like DNA/RNA helicase domain-containing protein n=1 Tax=Salsuginibacillus halophilus TaxID=517424 RepID=A0A2P8H8S0_9BACI|nr:DUF2075 domain-containing protein [Salsuginibacillus halophilus]PSL42580.1 hypothetical protein B0H94_11454 [Salsuginibacillus halophilus]